MLVHNNCNIIISYFPLSLASSQVLYKYMLFVLQTVHEGKWRGKRVAVKMMKETAMSDEGFIEEAKTMT